MSTQTDPGTPPLAHRNLVDLLHDRAREAGSKRLFGFLHGSDEAERSLSYGELHTAAMTIGGELQASVPPGGRALLLFPPGLDFIAAFFGCLYAGVVAVPVSAPRRGRTPTSLPAIVKACSPSVVLSTAAHRDRAKRLYEPLENLLSLRWLATDDIRADRRRDWVRPSFEGRQLAFLQYTSGSTASPRGVMLSHANLLENLARIERAFGNTESSTAVFWLPLHHDMGLIGGVLQPVYCGGSSTLLAPAAVLHRPLLWLQTISRTRASVSGGPDFAYDLCSRRTTASELAELDLSCWETAFTGAEPIHAATLDRFARTFATCGFRRAAFFPCYGLAEATLMVSGGPRLAGATVVQLDAQALARHQVRDGNGDGAPTRGVVGCGEGLPGQEIVIVDPERRRACSAERIGEIWVRGPCVAAGYFNRPEATQETFAARLEGEDEGLYLRTGDLGFLRNGQLYVTGRLKDLIIIRGRNFYPDDIEHAVEQAHTGFRVHCCAAFSSDIDGRERLIVVQEVEPRRKRFDSAAALQVVRRTVAAHFDLETYAVALAKAGTIPKTTSGKTRRSACRDLFLSGGLEAIAEWRADPEVLDSRVGPALGERENGAVDASEIERWLLDRIAARLKIPAGRIDVHTPFLEFGMGSLDAVQVSSDLETWLGRPLSPTAVYNHPTIADLARWLAQPPVEPGAGRRSSGADRPAERTDPDDLMREVRGLSQDEMEAYVRREMAKRQGTREESS